MRKVLHLWCNQGKADKIPSLIATQGLLKLRETVKILESKLSKAKTELPKGASNLEQGEGVFEISYEYEDNH